MPGTEVALAARALADKSGAAATPDRDEAHSTDIIDVPEEWVRDAVSTTSPHRFPYLAVLGGVAGVGLLVLLVISVVTVSDDSRRPAGQMRQAPSTSAAPSSAPSTRAVTPAPTSVAAPAMPAPQPVEPAPSEAPTAQAQPPVQAMAPQAPLTAETMRPEPPPQQPLQMFPRLHRWFPNMFAEG
jgi:type IV secretory pathway VirB10-like protein